MAEPALIEMLQQLLASGANGATIAIFFFIYRLDKRVSHLETLRILEERAAKRAAS